MSRVPLEIHEGNKRIDSHSAQASQRSKPAILNTPRRLKMAPVGPFPENVKRSHVKTGTISSQHAEKTRYTAPLVSTQVSTPLYATTLAGLAGLAVGAIGTKIAAANPSRAELIMSTSALQSQFQQLSSEYETLKVESASMQETHRKLVDELRREIENERADAKKKSETVNLELQQEKSKVKKLKLKKQQKITKKSKNDSASDKLIKKLQLQISQLQSEQDVKKKRKLEDSPT